MFPITTSLSIYESLCKEWRVQRKSQIKQRMMHLIQGLTCDLGGSHFAMEKHVQSAVAKFFAKQDTEWYSAGIHKLILRYNNCFNEQGDYVESRKFREESSKHVFKALSFFYQFCEQCGLTFETYLVYTKISRRWETVKSASSHSCLMKFGNIPCCCSNWSAFSSLQNLTVYLASIRYFWANSFTLLIE